MKNKKKSAEEVVHAYAKGGKTTDPNGSYTGVPRNKSEKPVQDADDL